MDFKLAFKDVKAGRLKPVYVCYGTESFLMEQFLQTLTAQIAPAEMVDFAVSKFDLRDTPIEMVVEDAEMPAFIAERKLIIAKDAHFLTGAKDPSKVEHQVDRLQQYLQAPVESSVLVLTVAAEKLDERKKIVKALKDKDLLIPFLHLSTEELKAWIQQQFVKQGAKAGPEAIDLLLVRAGTQLQTLTSEIMKLAMYVGYGCEVREEHVEEMIIPSLEQNIFLLVEHIVRGKLEKAMQVFHDLLKQKEEPIKILSLIVRQFRLMAQAKVLQEQGFAPSQIAQQLQLHPYAAKLAGEQARAYSHEKLRNALHELAELDYHMKSGQVDKTLGLELFLLKLAA